MKKFITVIGAALLLSGCAAVQQVLQPAQEQTPSKTTTAIAERGDLVLGLSADGSIALPVTGLDFAVSGIIKNVYVEAGDTVKTGDLLAELDDTDLQLALRTAKNNLEKAQLSYEETLANAEYTAKSETLNLASASEKLNETFDSYTYEQSIAAAGLSLERRNEDYADTELAVKTAEDSARLTLKRRQEDLFLTQSEVEAAKTEVDEALADLAEAEEDLADALAELERVTNEEIENFDEFTYQNEIKSAELKVTRMDRALGTAKNELTQARGKVRTASNEYKEAVDEYEDAYNDAETIEEAEALPEPSKSGVETAEENVKQKETALYNAQNNYDDAVRELELIKTNLIRDTESYLETEAEKKDAATESAEQTVEQARQTVKQAQQSVKQAEQSVTQAEQSVVQAQQQADDAQTALDNTLIENAQRLIDARQAVDDAQTNLQNAETELTRSKEQHRDGLRDAQRNYDLQALKLENISNSDLSVKNALFAIEEAQTELESAENDLRQTKITSTIDGEVLNITKKTGEKVTESENGGPGFFMGSGSTSNSFITIRDTGTIYISASVPEGDIVGLEVGQKIRAEVDALGEENLSASIYSISSVPSADSSGIISYEIIGVLDEYHEQIRDQMSVFLTFVKEEAEDVLLIPAKAVTTENGRQYVNVLNVNGVTEKRAVVCGLSNGTQTEIQDGLTEGETVVIGKAAGAAASTQSAEGEAGMPSEGGMPSFPQSMDGEAGMPSFDGGGQFPSRQGG